MKKGNCYVQPPQQPSSADLESTRDSLQNDNSIQHTLASPVALKPQQHDQKSQYTFSQDGSIYQGSTISSLSVSDQAINSSEFSPMFYNDSKRNQHQDAASNLNGLGAANSQLNGSVMNNYTGQQRFATNQQGNQFNVLNQAGVQKMQPSQLQQDSSNQLSQQADKTQLQKNIQILEDLLQHKFAPSDQETLLMLKDYMSEQLADLGGPDCYSFK